tara:strand:- start:18426 stop:18782 length:357 start_codon:yes stop_codon:yes gene_type:complete
MTFYDKAKRYSPILCRLLARKRYGRPLTSQEISDASGLSLVQVEALSQQTNWNGVDISVMRRFTRSCGTDFSNGKDMRRVSDYMRKSPTFAYLKRSKNFKQYYLPLISKWRSEYAGSG